MSIKASTNRSWSARLLNILAIFTPVWRINTGRTVSSRDLQASWLWPILNIIWPRRIMLEVATLAKWGPEQHARRARAKRKIASFEAESVFAPRVLGVGGGARNARVRIAHARSASGWS